MTITMNENDPSRRALKAASNDVSDAGGIQGDNAKSSLAQRLTLLLVEDDPDTQAFMKVLLRRYYEVAAAASEEEFWSVLENARPCLILMDVSLRGSQDGLTLTRQFRSEAKWNSVPVVALTAHATTEDRERALAAGCAAYVSKPVDRRRLLELIGSLIPS
jgi:CheY-like chemotaxis protein